jgi:hypothetical protein
MSHPELELTGAASALKYLETSVKRAQDRLDAAHEALDYAIKCQSDKPDEMDGTDFEVVVARSRAEVNDAETSLIRFSKTMLDYDKNVDTSRRDISVSITKADAEKFFFAFAICMRGSVEQIATRQAQDAMECKSSEDMFRIVVPLLRECFFSALKSATAEAQLPPWAAAAIEGAL